MKGKAMDIKQFLASDREDLKTMDETFADNPNILRYTRQENLPGVFQVRFYFANGRGASLITAPKYGIALELAALDETGDLDYTTDAVGPDVLRGTPLEITRAIHTLAALPRKEIEQ